MKSTSPWVPAKYTHFSLYFITFGFHPLMSRAATALPICHCICIAFQCQSMLKGYGGWAEEPDQDSSCCVHREICTRSQMELSGTTLGTGETRAGHQAQVGSWGHCYVMPEVTTHEQKWRDTGNLEKRLAPAETVLSLKRGGWKKRPGPITFISQ